MTSTPPSEGGTKSVSFAPPSEGSSASTTAIAAMPAKKRRSSIKEGAHMPVIPPKEFWQHPDPLIRRLRLKDGYGKNVNLLNEFRDAKVVAFLFGATWSGSIRETYETVEKFAKSHPHRLKIVYCSVDTNEQAYEANTRAKPWLSMEWDDGSAMSTDPTAPITTTNPLEPFLLASDDDLEADLHTTDPDGSLYTRPYSRVFLAEKFQVLGVPNLVVYHIGKQEVLSKRARIDSLKGDKGDLTWTKWENGERVELTLGDFAHALRWSLGFGVMAVGYQVAVRTGLLEDVIGQVSHALTTRYFGGA